MKALERWMLPFFLALSLASVFQCTGAQVVHNFSSDGCSLFPDGTIQKPDLWCECCFVHDIAYWQGGTEKDRLQADEKLRECVYHKTGDRALAETMFLGVRAGGQPVFPNWYRWGYGWNYGRGYKPLTESEKAIVSEKLKSYRKENPGGYCKSEKSGQTEPSVRSTPAGCRLPPIEKSGRNLIQSG